MSLRDVDMTSVLRRLADKRIEDAMKEGKFDNLPGAGQPLELDPMPANEETRMMWWALRILRNNDFLPEEIAWRKSIDHLKARLARVTAEEQIASLVKQINTLVHKLNTLGTNAIKTEISPLDEAEELAKFRARIAR